MWRVIPTYPMTHETWCAYIEGIFGYGLWIYETSEKEAHSKLKKAFYKWRKGYEVQPGQYDWYTFEEAMSYFSGSVEKIDYGRIYNDGLRY